MAYEGHRAMFEAFGRNKYTSTGVIQWMLNNAWPSMIWHLYDYYLRPGGAYFGTKKACEPLHVQYSYDDRSMVVVNSTYQSFARNEGQRQCLQPRHGGEVVKGTLTDVPPDSTNRVFTFPEIPGLTTTYFVRLTLEDSEHKTVSSNFYWLSTKPDVIDWENSTWFHTPTKSYDDLTALAGLPQVELQRFTILPSTGKRASHGSPSRTQRKPGLFRPPENHQQTCHPNEEYSFLPAEELPILWQDNYFSLMPGEKREITATYRQSDFRGTPPAFEVDGWNVKRQSF